MISRRTALKTGVTLPAAALAAAAPFRTALSLPGALPLERFVYDARFAVAFDIAQHARDLGVPLSPIADDLMDLWYDELDLRWRESPMALAGVTMNEALFVLETFAMDRQMRVVYRGEHGAAEDGRIAHRLAGPAQVVERFATPPPGDTWQSELARAMTECPLGRPDPAEVQFTTRAPRLELRDEPLVSWIIAPRSAVALTIPS